MRRKKIATLLIAGALALGIVGGSFAWFTSTAPQVQNSFATLGDGNEEGNGLEINETFDAVASNLAKPGDVINKDVRVLNKADFDQFIRVKFTKTATPSSLDTNLILLGLNTNNVITQANLSSTTDAALAGKWVEGADQAYYYIGKVAGNDYTSYLLDNVTLSGSAGNEWQKATYQVKVDANGVQASNSACTTEFAGAGKRVIDALIAAQ